MNSFARTEPHDQQSDMSLISSERVTGTNVYNPQGEKIGNIDSVMIDKHSGQVCFAVMSFGGFLGIGEKYHQLPWDGLTYSEEQEGYVVNVSREALEDAPSYNRDELDNFDYDNQSGRIDNYYSGLDGFYSPQQQTRRSTGGRVVAPYRDSQHPEHDDESPSEEPAVAHPSGLHAPPSRY